MSSSFLPEGLGEPANQILKDITAVNGANLVRSQITFLRRKLFDDQVWVLFAHATFLALSFLLNSFLLIAGAVAFRLSLLYL